MKTTLYGKHFYFIVIKYITNGVTLSYIEHYNKPSDALVNYDFFKTHIGWTYEGPEFIGRVLSVDLSCARPCTIL